MTLDTVLARYRGMRVGLVANPASVDHSFVHTADRLAASREVQLAALFGPQHGARAEKQDNMIESADFVDPHLGLPVFSLYGEHRKPTAKMLEGIDALFCDLFDVGARCYTFLWTMALCMEACAEHNVCFVVLDRPNPIGGAMVEGNVLDDAMRSFVGLYPLPMRHGMTAGEIATLINCEYGIGAELDVVDATAWQRHQWHDDARLPWVMPSPNMPSLDTATVYPGSVLLEATNLSEGRGTTRPFEIVGAPFIDAARFAARLNERKPAGVRFRPVWFEPAFDKWHGTLCGGVQVHVRDRAAFQPYRTGLELLAAARELYPAHFAWRQPPFEYEHKKMPIDLLTGSSAIREALDAGTDPAAIERAWQPGLEQFLTVRERYLRY